MNKITWIIVIGIAVVLAVAWWWFRAALPTPAPIGGIPTPPPGTSAPGAAIDTTSQITQELNTINIDQLDLRDIDADLNQL